MADTTISALTALTGANLAAGDRFVVDDVDAAATKHITAAELFTALPVVLSTAMLGSDVVPATDELLVSDAGVMKTMTFDELISAIFLNGVLTLSDISGPHADQAAAATAISGTGKFWYQTTTGLIGITLT